MKKILFVCEDHPHPIHEAFAKSIDADFFYLPEGGILKKIKRLSKIPGNYKVYFSEGLFGYLYLAKKIGILSKEAKCVNLFSDPRLYQIKNKIKFNFNKLRPERYSFLKRKFQIEAIKSLDGAICIGKYSTSLLERISRNTKIKTVSPLIERKIFLNSKYSKLNKGNILSIISGPDYHYKGLDFLIKIFQEVSKVNPKSKLFVVGPGWDDFKKNIKNNKIIFCGKKSDREIINIILDSSLYCHFGRGEALGIAVLEAMGKGLPCIVSEETGAKEYVAKIKKEFVVDMKNKDEIVEKINRYFRLSSKNKRKIGNKFKKYSKRFSKEGGIKIFKREFNRLLREIE